MPPPDFASMGEMPLTDRADALAGLRSVGAAHVAGHLRPPARAELQDAVDRLVLGRAPRSVGPVDQRAWAAVRAGRELVEHPVLHRFTEAGRRELSALGEPTLGAWRPNELTIMRYDGVADGISPHLDRRGYRLLIAVFSLSGRAELDIVADRSGHGVLAAFVCEPGDLVLLRAPGFAGNDDGRPLHRVRPIGDGARVSITLRMAAEPPA